MSLYHFRFMFRASKAGSLVYISQPKAGCSTIQMTMANLYAQSANMPLLMTPHGSLDREYLTFFNDPGRQPLEEILEQAKLFTCVRNPFTRILSAYLDKIERQTKEYEFFCKVHNIELGKKISFHEFVSLLETDPYFLMDHHWLPQSEIAKINIFNYSHIGFLERLDEELSKILNIAGLTETIQKYTAHSTNSWENIERYYDDEIAEVVKRLYKQDFIDFGQF